MRRRPPERERRPAGYRTAPQNPNNPRANIARPGRDANRHLKKNWLLPPRSRPATESCAMITLPMTADWRMTLAKVLGMLGSDPDGEIAAAGRRANAIIKAANLSWFDLPVPMSSQPDEDAIDAEMATFCLARTERLNEREQEFIYSIVSLLRRGRSLTAKQRKWLGDIASRIVSP
jgi:hypothetical protein